MSSLGLPEILLIAVIAFIVFVIFGPKNLPKLGKMFGSTMKEVRKGMTEFSDEMSYAGDVAEEEAQAPVEQVSSPAASSTDGAVIEPGRKVAKVIYEDEVEQVAIDPERKVAKVIYEDEVE